jgi:Flp pilus assembly protein TadD
MRADGALGRSDDKIAALRGIAEQTEEIAKVLQQSSKLDKAAENSAKALGLRTEIVNRSDADPVSYRDLGLSLYRRGDPIKLMTGEMIWRMRQSITRRPMRSGIS